MRILLTNTPLKRGPQLPIPRVAVDKGTGDMPLGLLYLAASLKSAGFKNVSVLDILTLGLGPDRAAEKVAYERPDLLGVTVYSFSCRDLAILAKKVRDLLPKCHICLGGPHIATYPELSLQGRWCDSVCVGYGEGAIVALAKALERGEAAEAIPGIGWKKDGEPAKVCHPLRLEGIDSIPFPDRRIVDRSLYSSWVVDRPVPATSILTSRGCPFRCTFCSQSRTSFAQRSVGNVLCEVKQCRDQGFRMIYFQDDSMNSRTEWMLEFASAMGAIEDGPAWCFRGRVTNFDDEVARSCARGGCVRVQFGIEAGTDEVQETIGKGIDLSHALTAVKAAKKAQISTVCYFIMGFPGETVDQMRHTYVFARLLDPDFAIFSPLYLLPGTELYEREKRLMGDGFDPYAKYTEHPSRDFVPPPPTGTVTRKAVFWTVRLAYFRFYFSPRFLLSGRGAEGGIMRGVRGGLSLLAYLFFGLRRWK